MPDLTVLAPGLLTSIQDTGRKGLAFYAVPASGAADAHAARIALLLLRLPEHFALLECTSVAPTLRFEAPTRIVLTGADFGWKLNETKVSLHTVLSVGAGDVLSGKYAVNGLRGYLALAGKLAVKRVFDSAATCFATSRGGHAGRRLEKGDVLTWEEVGMPADGVFTLLPGPEYHFLAEQGIRDLCENIYKISADSNRMGARLTGKPLESKLYNLPHSVPVLPGFVQLPPSGMPIVVLQDGQTTGGYARIAYLRKEDLSRFNQIPLGGEVRFVI